MANNESIENLLILKDQLASETEKECWWHIVDLDDGRIADSGEIRKEYKGATGGVNLESVTGHGPKVNVKKGKQ